MVLYEDKTPQSSRMIWVEFNAENKTIRLDLQDLGDDFECERSMSDISLDAFLLENYSSSDAMDRISDDILDRHEISYLYYSC